MVFPNTATATPTFTPTCTVTPVGEILVYPNPFNPARAVGRTLKITGLQPDDIVRFYTVTGEKVIETTGISGRWEWDGKNRDGSSVASGIYIWVVERRNGEKFMGKVIVID